MAQSADKLSVKLTIEHVIQPVRYSELSAPAHSIWAKSGQNGGHNLLAHMLDVAAVVEVLLEREPPAVLTWVSKALGIPVKEVGRWVATLIGLHDYGKAIPGFQDKWPEGRAADVAAGLVFERASMGVTDHALATAALLGPSLRESSQAEISWVLHVLQAISAHHGYNFVSKKMEKSIPLHEHASWKTARTELFTAYWNTLRPVGKPTVRALDMAGVQWLAGLTSVADWIGSNTDWFPLGQRCDDFIDYFVDAKQRAKAALDAIGWVPYRKLLNKQAGTNHLIQRILGSDAQIQARPLQVVGDQLLQHVSGPALFIVEAPTGEGKTELAFIAQLRLQAANNHRGLYLALPTQATGNALFVRALAFLQEFSAGQQLDMQLVHGSTDLNEHVNRLRNVEHSCAESVSVSAWFSQRRRPLLSPYGVGTIDQALFSVLNVKHHFVRLWGLSNRVVVLDEVHAYDTYTTGLIQALLRWLKCLGSSVVLMSATLPNDKRNDLLKAWGANPDSAPSAPYPRLLLADDNGLAQATFDARPLSPIQLIPMGSSLADLQECVLECLQSGGCGAVIVNTVARAQQLYLALKAVADPSVDLLLFHARYPADERSVREQQVLGMFGKRGDRPEKGLLIATQVAEQSLDICFDFMLTDLAPVDLILQRAGRLHRHIRARVAAHEQARLFIAGLHSDRFPDLKETGWGYVYEPYILARTWAFLARENTLVLPGDVDRLVQIAYADEDLPLEVEVAVVNFIETELFGYHLGREAKEKMQAHNLAIDPAAKPGDAYTNHPAGYEEGENQGMGFEKKTRLGADSITFIPVHSREGGWSVTPDGPIFNPHKPMTDALARQLYVRQIRLSHKDLVPHFTGLKAPLGFSEHPLLRHIQPLLLTDLIFQIDNAPVLRLDAELGVVYQEKNRPEARPYVSRE